jgi:hypothetical protein
VSASPTRGVESKPAVLKGNAIGLNLSNKFRVDESNNQFVVTVDDVTGIITIPPKAEYTAEGFRQLSRTASTRWPISTVAPSAA